MRFGSYGRIAFHPAKGDFEATCCAEGHIRCRLTRRAIAGPRAGQGRPLGLIAAWLMAASDYSSKDEHKDVFVMALISDLENRKHGRSELAKVDGAQALFACERPLAPEEPDEPIVFDAV